MVSAFSPNIQLEEPARGDQVGTWDTPVNNNMTLIDLVCGGRTTISLNNSNVVLSSPQYECKTITFNSTLTGSVLITFPTSFTKSYEILNLCTGTSAFTITLQTTAAGGQVIGAKPGEFFGVVSDGTNIKFRGLGHIGSYWDYAGSSVPSWVSICTVPPYLNCDGTTFSAATYPALSTILGSTTLPDSRGRFRAVLNQATARLQSSVSINGDTNYTGGGSQFSQQHGHSVFITDPGHTHTNNAAINTLTANGNPGSVLVQTGSVATINSAVTGITATASNSGAGNTQNVPPAYIGGLTLIRAA